MRWFGIIGLRAAPPFVDGTLVAFHDSCCRQEQKSAKKIDKRCTYRLGTRPRTCLTFRGAAIQIAAADVKQHPMAKKKANL